MMFRESVMRFPSSATTFRLSIIGMAFAYTILYLHTSLSINASLPHDDTFRTANTIARSWRWIASKLRRSSLRSP